MNNKALAHNLAQSLTLGPWSREFIRSTLSRRLPRQLQHLVDGLSLELIACLPRTYSPNVKAIAVVLMRSNQLQKVLHYCIQHDVWPDPELSPPAMSPVAAFATVDLPQLPTINALTEWLFLPIERMEYLADLSSRFEDHADEAVRHYWYILQTKKSGRMRIIEAPKPQLKAVQRQILRGILDKVPIHGDAFGFARGRNCLDAASRHVGEEAVLRFDLKNFFPSIGMGRIFGLFRCLGYPHEVARVLSGFCTSVTPLREVSRIALADREDYRRPHLPQGSPASPALANLAAFRLDRRLSALAKSLDAHYSRYADDLSFSGDKTIVGTLLRVVPSIVVDEGFSLNVAKTRIMSKASRQMVTNIVVNDRLNVDRRVFDLLKAIIHECGKSHDLRLDDPAFRESLLGKIGWVETINPQRGEKLRELLTGAIARRS